MSFTNNFGTIIKRFDKKINTIFLDNGISYCRFNSNLDLIYRKEIINGYYSFADVWFDVNKDDTLYGLVNLKNGTLSHLYINNKFLIFSNILKYNPNLYNIKFPFIKNFGNNTHIIYYLINGNTPSSCKFIHHYKKEGKWIKSQIDNVHFSILSNFTVTCTNSALNLFYFNIVDGTEELFVSSLDLTKNSWSLPVQITNSNKNKVYLSVIQDSNNLCHVVFSENNFGKYYCYYLNVYIKDNKFIPHNHAVISDTIACAFPNVLENNNIIYIQWLEYNTLYKSYSKDLGISWSKPVSDNKSFEYLFSSFSYRSNSPDDKAYNFSNIFAINNSIEALGLDDINLVN